MISIGALDNTGKVTALMEMTSNLWVIFLWIYIDKKLQNKVPDAEPGANTTKILFVNDKYIGVLCLKGILIFDRNNKKLHTIKAGIVFRLSRFSIFSIYTALSIFVT